MITITEMAEVHAARIAERDAQIASLTEEIERLTDWLAVENVRNHRLSEELSALQPKEGGVDEPMQ